MVRAQQDRELVAVVITTDGRRVPVRFADTRPVDTSIPGILRLIGLRLLALIGGSRRESEGRR